MASPPPPLDRTPSARRSPYTGSPYTTPSLFSPHSISSSGTITPVPTTLPFNSHYYRPPRSSLTSPTRSIISSTTGSPTRTTRQTRVQRLLADDPLLSRLTPLTVSRLSNDPDFGFSIAEKEWSLRAAEGIVKVGEWLREVEGWNLEWRRNGKGGGVGYLPPNLDRPKKRRKMGLEEKGEMRSIKEETEECGEVVNGKRRPLRRELFMDRGTDTSDSEEEGGDRNGVLKREGAVEGTNGGQSRKPLMLCRLGLQRQKAEAEGENIPVKEAPISTPTKGIDRPIHEEYDGESTDEDEGVEYWGSLKRVMIEHCLARVELIKSEIEELDVEALKSKVLAYRTGTTNPLTDSSAIITAITLQLLPPLHRLTKLLSIWAVRLAVLRIVPVFLRWLQIAKDALDAGHAAINHPSISPSCFSSQDNTSWRGLEEETFTLMQETVTQKVATAGKLMDTMLDALEGREDVLPDVWITELEDVEERVGAWEMDGERVVLEGRLRLEELRQRESRREEQEREREKTQLIIEQERFVEEARGAESVVECVMEHAEETERGLREAMEANEDVVEGIELVGDEGAEGSGDEGAVPGEINELFMRLEGIENERLFSREASDSETEDDHGLLDPSSWRGMGGSYTDVLPSQHRVLMPRHGLSLGSFTQPDLDSGPTTFHTPLLTPFIPHEGLVGKYRRASTTSDFYTPMPTPGMQQESPPSRPGSTTPTQFHIPMSTPLTTPPPPKLRRHSTTPFYTPMPTPLMPAFQQGPPVLRRQPSMPCMPVPKLPPTAQIFTATARREPPSPETPKRVSTEIEKEVKKTSPSILAAARYFFKTEKEEETKKERMKREEEAKKEEAGRRDEEEREMIAAVDAETERLVKLEEAEKVRAEKVKVVKEKLAEAEKMREKERAVREIEERRKVAEAERKRFVEEERRKKTELEAARVKAEEVERQKKVAGAEAEDVAPEIARLKAEEEEKEKRLRKVSIERVSALEAASLAAEAEHQRSATEETSIIVEEARQVMDEDEGGRQWVAEKECIAAEEAEAGRQGDAEAKEEAERKRQANPERLAALGIEEEQKRHTEEETERQPKVEAECQRLEEAERERRTEVGRLAAVEVARAKAEAEAEAGRRRLIEEEERKRQAKANKIATIEVPAEHRRVAIEESERKRQVEVQRLAALALARIAAEEEQRRQAEVERLAARLKADAEAEAEAERLRLVEEVVELQRHAETERLAAIEAAHAEEERVRLAEKEAERQHPAEVDAECIRVNEEETAHIKAETEAAAERRQLAEEEAEQQRKAELERLAVTENECQISLEVTHAAEVKHQQLVEEEAKKKRQADIQRLTAFETARIKAEDEAAGEAKCSEEEVARQRKVELQRLSAIETARMVEQEAEHQKMIKLEDDHPRATEEVSRRNAEAHAEEIRCAKGEVAFQHKAEFEPLAAIETARVAREEAERQRMAEEEAEKQRLTALEAERQRILKQERKAEDERQQEEQVRLDAEAEEKRLAELEMQRVAEAEAEVETENLRAVKDEEIRNPIAEQKVKWLGEEEEVEWLREIEEEQIRNTKQGARWEAEEEEDRRMVARLQREAMEAEVKVERRHERDVDDMCRLTVAEQERLDPEDEAELRMIARIQTVALEAGAEQKRQHVVDIGGEERRGRVTAYEAKCEAEEEAERERISDAIAVFGAANAEDERQQEEKWAVEEEAGSDLTFEEFDRRRRLAEDERQRLADLALVEREQKRLATQKAERLRMEKHIEDTRLEAERLREQEEEKQRQAQFSNHQGSNSEGDSISGDDITEDYQDGSSFVQSLPLKEADEGSEAENIYAEARKNQPSVPPRSVPTTPITSRASQVLGEMKYTTPEENPCVQSSTASGSQEDDSEASSDMDNLVAVENLAAHNSLQQVLNDSAEYELPQNMQGLVSGSSFSGMPSTLVAPSTPHDHSDVDDSKNITKTTIWDHAVHSPDLDGDDGPPDLFADGSFPSGLNIDETNHLQLSVEDYEQEDCSDFDMAPLATSTPKPKRRPNTLGGLDSITEVLTPRSPRDEFFRPSDDNAFGTPSKKSGNLMLPGVISGQDSPMSRKCSFNNRKATPNSLGLEVGKMASSQNKLAVKRGTTPEPNAPVKGRSQKLTRKAPLDMARPRSLSSTGNYISPGSTTTKPVPKPASQNTILGPAIKAIRKPYMEIDSDDEGSVMSEQRWSRSTENTSDLNSSPPTPNLCPVPRLSVNKRNTQKPPILNTQVMSGKSKRLHQRKGSYDEEGSISSQGAPQTPRLEFPQSSLDDKVNEILASLPSPVRLTASNLQKLSETSNKRQPPLRPFELTSPTGIPAPKSVSSNSVVSDAPSSYARGGRKHNSSTPGDIKLYHLHRNDGQTPIKLYIRLVGERGERVMVRVGGGWADLAEYLKEYATHHASKRRAVSGGGIEIQDLSGPHHHTLHPSRSISSLRSHSPAPGTSRSNSPNPSGRSRSVSAVGIHSRPNSASGNRPNSSMGNRPASSMGNRPDSSMGARGRERGPPPAQSLSLTSPPAVMRSGHNGTGKDRPNLTQFQPLAYQRPNGLSPPGSGTSRPPSRGQGASRPPSRGQGASRPPSRPGSSHSTAGGIRRPASRLSCTESAFDVSEASSPGDEPLGLAGPKGKKTTISPENQAWVEGMMGEVRKASGGRKLTSGSNNGDVGLGNEPFTVPGEMVEAQSGTTGQHFGDMDKQGGGGGVTRRIFLKMG